MRRSEINAIMRSADEFIRARGFYLPPFAHWSAAEWQSHGPEVAEIVASRLGWDITDFGSGDFSACGLFLFTLRNGRPENWEKRSGKLYAEKIMIVEKDQRTPLHFHWNKMEDIINRGGGRLLLRLYRSTPDERLDEHTPVDFVADGVARTVVPGELVALEPGESITLEPFCYHEFWADARTLVGEVSLVNDDESDNRFLNAPGRFPAIEEDEAPLYLLCTDYEHFDQAL